MDAWSTADGGTSRTDQGIPDINASNGTLSDMSCGPPVSALRSEGTRGEPRRRGLGRRESHAADAREVARVSAVSHMAEAAGSGTGSGRSKGYALVNAGGDHLEAVGLIDALRQPVADPA